MKKPGKTSKPITKRQQKLKMKKQKQDRLWRQSTRVLKLNKTKTMHAILSGCTCDGSPLFPENVNHLITHFLDAAYSYQIRFCGNKYKLRISGHERMTLKYFIELFTKHAYGIKHGRLPENAKITTKMRNLLFLQHKYNEHAPLIVTNQQTVTRHAPREKRLGKFCHVILDGAFDWNSDKRYETTIQLGHFHKMPKW